MKTISGHCVPVKDILVSKAAKILTKFVSADNGASLVINAYLHRASASFNELKQLHKELGSSHSHKKHKRHITENGNDSGIISLDLPKVKNPAKGKVLMQAMYGVKVETVFICRVFTAAFSGLSNKLSDLNVADIHSWA